MAPDRFDDATHRSIGEIQGLSRDKPWLLPSVRLPS